MGRKKRLTFPTLIDVIKDTINVQNKYSFTPQKMKVIVVLKNYKLPQ